MARNLINSSPIPLDGLNDAADATIGYRELLAHYGLPWADLGVGRRCPDPRVQKAHDDWSAHLREIARAVADAHGEQWDDQPPAEQAETLTQAFDLVEAAIDICRLTIEDPDGTPHTCTRPAARWHIHRDSERAWFFYPFNRIYVRHLHGAERKAALATLTNARHQLDRNTIPEDHDELNDAVTKAEKNVLFGRWRGWKYEART